MKISEIQKEIVEELEDFEDWNARFMYICDLGKDELEGFPKEFMVEKNQVRGCVSKVWLVSKLDDQGLLHFQGDSDSLFVKGLVALVLRVYSGQRPSEILAHPPEFLTDAGLLQNLTPTRGNGVASMVKAIMQEAQKAQS